MTMPPDAEIHTLAASYALHALPDDEVLLFERHLAECSACRAEVSEIRETTARLGEAAAITPPPELKARVLERIAGVRPLPPVVDAATDSPDSSDHLDTADQAPSPRGPLGWQRWWPRLAVAAVAALAAVVAVLGVQLGQVRDELEQSQASGVELRELVAAPDVEVVRTSADGTTGIVVMSRSLDTAVLVADGLEPAPEGQTYQLWAFVAGAPQSAGVLGSSVDGRIGPFSAHGVAEASQLGVTVEPAGGSRQPTSDPVLLIGLPAL